MPAKKKVTPEKKIDVHDLSTVPKLGDVSIKALNNAGYFDMTQLMATSNPIELATLTGKDKKEAGEIFENIRKALVESNIIPKRFRTGSEVLADRKKIERISTGCRAFDAILDGGFEIGSVYAAYGKNSAGKSQLSHTLATNTLLHHPVDGKIPLVVYIDTENTYRPERIITMLASRGIIPDVPTDIKKKDLEGKLLTGEELKQKEEILKNQQEEAGKYLDNILVLRATDVFQLILFINEFTKMFSEKMPIKFLVIDSFIDAFRSQYLGRGTMHTKFQVMNDVLHKLRGLAETYKIPVLLINQIHESPEEMYGKDKEQPSGGNIMGHAPSYIIYLEEIGSGKKHKATMKKSSYLPENEALFTITSKGLEDFVK